MPTAQSLIENACLALNVIDTGEGLSASELADALVRLNALIGNWNIQELMATSAVIDTVAISADAETATLATAYRKLISASHLISSTFIQPIEIINAVQWNKIPDRGISGNLIRFLFYDRAGGSTEQTPITANLTTASTVHTTTTQINVALANYTVTADDVGAYVVITGGSATAGVYQITAADTVNNRWTMDRSVGTSGQTVVGTLGGVVTSSGGSAKVYVSPRPKASGTISFAAWPFQATFASLSTNNVLLPGYERALILSLAVEVASMLSAPVTQELLSNRAEALAEIRQLNASLMGDVAPATPAG